MNAHITKKFLRFLLSRFHVKIFPFLLKAAKLCLVFMWRYFIFHHRTQSAPNVHFQILQNECFQIAQWKESFNSEMNAYITTKFLRLLLCGFYVKIFPFLTETAKCSKFPLAGSTKREFQNCSIQRKVQVCEMNAHITKKFLRILLSSFYVKIFPSKIGPKVLQMSACRFYIKSVSKLLHQKKCSTPWD